MDSNQPRSSLTLPGAIIIAAALIAIAIMWVKKPVSIPVSNNQNATSSQSSNINLSPITAADHILGDPNAPIKIVEYSDPSCPYCKMFNPTMEDIISQYGPTGDVAWVYRHFPLDKPDPNGNILHKNAGHESQAMECVAGLGGNDKFWKFEKTLYETTPSVTGATPGGLDQSQLPTMAKSVGIDETSFNDCLSSGRFKDAVEKQYLTGVNAGVSGTPTSFFVLIKPANRSVSDYLDNALITYKLQPSLLFMADDKMMISMSGAMPKELIAGLITAIQTGQ
jgi:protein-disulfide isomerase